jgi:hypothetical protein
VAVSADRSSDGIAPAAGDVLVEGAGAAVGLGPVVVVGRDVVVGIVCLRVDLVLLGSVPVVVAGVAADAAPEDVDGEAELALVGDEPAVVAAAAPAEAPVRVTGALRWGAGRAVCEAVEHPTSSAPAMARLSAVSRSQERSPPGLGAMVPSFRNLVTEGIR